MDWTSILLGGVIAAIVLFVWSGIAWMGLRHHMDDYRAAPKDQALIDALGRLPPVDAFYSIPHFSEFAGGMKDPALDARYRQGPNAIVIRTPPGPCMSGATFGKGFAINLVEGIGCAALLQMVRDHVTGFFGTVLFYAGVGAFLAVAVFFSLRVWAMLPWRFTLTNTFDKIVGYALLGIVMHLTRPTGSSLPW
jgi:hypothetical protein